MSRANYQNHHYWTNPTRVLGIRIPGPNKGHNTRIWDPIKRSPLRQQYNYAWIIKLCLGSQNNGNSLWDLYNFRAKSIKLRIESEKNESFPEKFVHRLLRHFVSNVTFNSIGDKKAEKPSYEFLVENMRTTSSSKYRISELSIKRD